MACTGTSLLVPLVQQVSVSSDVVYQERLSFLLVRPCRLHNFFAENTTVKKLGVQKY
jgi:hypothetical protein